MSQNKKKRTNYLDKANKIPKYGAYFVKDNKPDPAAEFVEEKVIDMEGVKPDYYILNNQGVLINIKGDSIKPCLINSGYYTFRLTNGEPVPDRKYKHILVHRLVKQLFDPVENFEELTVNHRNMDRSDNRLSNLEYMTQAENNEEKQRNIVYRGTNIVNATFNKQQLKVIVDEIDKGEKTYREILLKIGLEPTKVNCDYVGNIKRGITYQQEAEEIRRNR